MTSSAPAGRPEVFQCSLVSRESFSRIGLRSVPPPPRSLSSGTGSRRSSEVSLPPRPTRQLTRSLAVLGAILFQRVLGNLRPSSVDVAGVTFVSPSAPARLAGAHHSTARTLRRRCRSSHHRQSRRLQHRPPLPDSSTPPRTHSPLPPSWPLTSPQLILALYPTPLSPRDPPPPKPRQPAVSTALGWFSASAKALGAGGEEEGGEVDDRDCGKVWEGWVIEVEVVGEGRRGGGEERECVCLDAREWS